MNRFTLVFHSIAPGMQRGLAALCLTSCLLAACSQIQTESAITAVQCPTVSVRTSPYNNQVAGLLQADYSADSLAVHTIVVNSRSVRFVGFIPAILSTHYDNLHDVTTIECAAGTLNHNYIYIVVNKNATYILRVIARSELQPDHVVADRLPSADEILSATSGNAMNPNVIRVDESKIYVEDGLFASITQKVSTLDSRLVSVQGIEYREAKGTGFNRGE